MTSAATKRKPGRPRAAASKAPMSSEISALTQSILAACRRSETITSAIKLVVDVLRNVVPFDALTLYRPQDSGGELQPVYDTGKRVGMIDFLSIGAGEGLTGWSAETSKPVLLSDRSRTSQYDPDEDHASFLSYPVCLESHLVAVLNFGGRLPGSLNKKEIDALDKVALTLAFSLENIFLHHDLDIVNKTRSDIEKSLEQTRDLTSITRNLIDIIDMANETNHVVNEALSVIIGNVQCLLVENGVVNQKGISRLRRVEQAALNINECNGKLLRIAALVEKATQSTRRT